MRLAYFICLLAISDAALGQTSSVQRTVVTKSDISINGREAIVVRVTVAPDGTIARHKHYGDEIGYLQEGEVEMQVEGDMPQTLKAGSAFVIPAGKAHEARNKGNRPASLLVTYVVEKNKPLAIPAK